MSGVLRLTNDGGGSGRSTLVADADSDQTFRLPEAGGTLLTNNYDVPGGTITFNGSDFIITNGDLNVDDGTLFVDEANNRVGIGTITPEALLQLDAGAGTDATLNLRMGTDNSGANESIISWVNSAGSEIFKTYFSNTVGNAQFRVAATLGGFGDIVYINRSGEVGVGASPASGVNLHVLSNGTTQLRVDNTSATGNAQLELIPGGRTEPWYVYAATNGDYIVQDNSSVRFRINSDGDAAFSSQAPTAKVSLTKGSPDYMVDIRSATANKQWGVYYAQNSWLQSTFRIDEFDSSGTAFPRIAIVNKEYGFGTFTPDEAFHFVSSGDIKLKVTSSNGSNCGLTLESLGQPASWILQTGSAAGNGIRLYDLFNGVERFRINPDGSSTFYTAHTNVLIARSANVPSTDDSIFVGVSNATTNQNGTVRYRVYTNGTSAAVSDEREKKNIETTRQGYLEDINRLRVVKYNWKEQNDNEPRELGLIAQEVEKVFPGLVSSIHEGEEGEQFKGIKTSVLPFMLLKALQEATDRIEALEAEVSKFRSK